MMMLMVILPAMMIAATAGQAPAPASNPVVQIGVFAYQGDGSVTGRAVSTAVRDAVVWSSESLCKIGAGLLPTDSSPGNAWKFSTTLLSQTDDQAVIQLDWQRTHENGQEVPGRASSVQLTLRRDEPAVLDVVLPTTTTCGVARAAFEARYEPWSHPKLPGTSGGGAVAGVGVVRRGASATGTATPPASRSGAGAVRSRSAAAAGGVELLDMTLWLVHQAPGREEQVTQQSLRSTNEGARFAFPPVTIDVTGGQVTMQVDGSYAVTEEGRKVAFTMNRATQFQPSSPGPHKMSVARSSGEGKTVIDMPKPDEVVEFALPPFGVPVGPGGPDKFSIRVRIRQVK